MVNQRSTYRKPVKGNKAERSIKANDWLKELDSRWHKEVEQAVQATSYNNLHDADTVNRLMTVPLTKEYASTVTRVFCNDVVTCAKAAVTHAEKGDKVCVLNFASYTSPGGGFLKGSTAQEEALCFATGLYPCLEQWSEKYEQHKNEETDGCYSHDYIYSKDVPFIVNGKCYFIDVLTMAAPNQKASRFSPVEDIFEERMELAFRLPVYMNNVKVILLGAWGCGAFGNDPKFVASTWRTLTNKYNGVYKEVVHPVLDSQMCKTFKEVLNGQDRKAHNSKSSDKRKL